ncbi:MAG TPA: hypothetical protein VFF55_04350, partial [Candidatus Deferrimicrobium sp.]|nr:hypothetical protein [Candidatus Deferrimicrobium sp.]
MTVDPSPPHPSPESGALEAEIRVEAMEKMKVHVGKANTIDGPAENVFEVREFNAYYGSFRAVKDIDMDIPKNRITAFIGPSGCGK